MSKQSTVSEQNEQYFPLRNAIESARLSCQHHTFVARQGYLLHPTIADSLPTSEADPIHVSGLATGNGIWTIELSHTLPRDKYHSTVLDISSAQYPPLSTWPNNVHFDTYNIFTDPPKEYKNKFKVVHIHFISAILWQDARRKITVLMNVESMLKPGGWLQWQEPTPPLFASIDTPEQQAAFYTSDASIPLAVELMMDKLRALQTGSAWLNELDRFVTQDGGFADVQAHWVPLRPDRGKYENDLCVGTGEQ